MTEDKKVSHFEHDPSAVDGDTDLTGRNKKCGSCKHRNMHHEVTFEVTKDGSITLDCRNSNFKPDPDFGKMLGEMFSDNKKRGGKVITIIEEEGDINAE